MIDNFGNEIDRKTADVPTDPEDIQAVEEVKAYIDTLQSLIVSGCNTCDWIGVMTDCVRIENEEGIEIISCPVCNKEVGHVSVEVLREMREEIKGLAKELKRLNVAAGVEYDPLAQMQETFTGLVSVLSEDKDGGILSIRSDGKKWRLAFTTNMEDYVSAAEDTLAAAVTSLRLNQGKVVVE